MRRNDAHRLQLGCHRSAPFLELLLQHRYLALPRIQKRAFWQVHQRLRSRRDTLQAKLSCDVLHRMSLIPHRWPVGRQHSIKYLQEATAGKYAPR